MRVEPCLAPAGLAELPTAASHSAGWPPPSEADTSPALGAERCRMSPRLSRIYPFLAPGNGFEDRWFPREFRTS